MAVAMLFMLIIDIQYSFTGWPRQTIIITPDQDKILQSISIHNYLGDWSVFAYFTMLSNCVAVVSIVLCWIFNIKMKAQYRNAAFIYMLVTAIIFWIAIAPIMPWGSSSYFDFIYVYEHLLAVMLTGLWWFSYKPETIGFKQGIKAVLWLPGLYLAFSIIFYISINGKVAIYPFLNFANMFNLNLPIFGSIVLAIVIITLVISLFVALSWLVNYLNIRRMQKENKKNSATN